MIGRELERKLAWLDTLSVFVATEGNGGIEKQFSIPRSASAAADLVEENILSIDAYGREGDRWKPGEEWRAVGLRF